MEERMANSSINSSKQENTVEKKLSFCSSKPEIVVKRNSSFASWEDSSMLKKSLYVYIYNLYI